MRATGWALGAAAVLALGAACGSGEGRPQAQAASAATAREFDADAAMRYLNEQLAFGPRVPGTAAHRQAGDWIQREFGSRADTVLVQAWTHVTADGQRIPMRNVLARFAPANPRRVLYVAHWDSRPRAEKSMRPEDRAKPVPGANDGASGVALLLAVADALKARPAGVGVDLLLVDGEDWGDFDTNIDVLIGARHFAANLPSADYRPEVGVLWDMIGKPDARFLYESNSVRAAPEIIQRVWGTAQRLGHGEYFPTREYGPITDDHLPLIEAGLKVIDVIDLDYAYHHSVEDTADKVSRTTLQVVGDVALAVLRGM